MKLKFTTFNCPHVENSSENSALKTSAKKVFQNTDVEACKEGFSKLLREEETYDKKNNGFTLQSMDGLMLRVYYGYTTTAGCSYVELPKDIQAKNVTINP